MTPYLVDRIENSDGTTVESFKPSAYGEIMTASEAKQLRKMMKEVVQSGTATGLASSVYTAAGKTGSAEYGTNKGDSHAWFVGYAKANTTDSDSENAKTDIAIAVLVEGAGSGSSVGVPIAKTVFDTYFK
jgi:peptidoglycan glycosyltransferase